jgi:hypothetical protein
MVRPTLETTYADANNEHEKALVAVGALEAVIQCMQSHPGHVGVQAEGCFALMCLAAEGAHKVRAAEAGGIDVILATMTQHRDSTEVQWYGCKALANVAANIDANKRTIAEKGGIDVILAAMKQHPDSAEVQKYGCWAGWVYFCETVLYNLGMEPTNEDVEALLMELGATPDGIVTFVEFTGVLARLKV